MKVNKLMFREYDIRGIYGDDITPDVAYLVGRAFATNLKKLSKDTTIVGYDNRVSSVILEENLVKGLMDGGINVLRLGLVTTPMYYFSWDFLNVKCGIMITASHNPKEYNGFKFSYNGIHNAYGADVYDLYDVIEAGNFSEGNGSSKNVDIKNDYIKLILNGLSFGSRKLKVVYDCGNGTTSVIAPSIFSKLPFDMIPLYAESDSNFPNHHPDPCVEENLSDLKKAVIENKADVGIAFDGDGDRVGVVDEFGNMVEIDKYMIIIWRDIYNKVENKRGLFDVKCSKVLEDELIKLGIEPVCYRTGNSYTKAMSVEGDFPFSGEYSGHVFFRDRFPGYDDGIYAGLRLLEILSKTDKSVSGLLDGINVYYATKELKREVGDSVKFKIVDDVRNYCIQNDYKILTIDGVKVLFEDGSAVVRASNTGPNLTMRYEAKSRERLNEIEMEFTNLLDKLINVK